MKLSRALLGPALISEVVVASIAPGTLMGGGHWGGRIQIGANQYDLIVSPHALAGFYTEYDWNVNANQPYTYWDFDIEFNASINDGYGIMQEAKLVGVGNYGALSIFSNITLNGFSDWYAPSLHEMEILYRNLKPTTAANNTAFGTNSSAVPPSSNYDVSVPAQTSYVPFRSGNVSQFLEEVHFTATRGLSGNKQTYATFSFIDGSIGEAPTNEARPTRAIRRQLVV